MWTHRVDVQRGGASLHRVDGGEAAVRRRLQRVVGGVDCGSAGWILQGEVGMDKAVRLRKHQEQRWRDITNIPRELIFILIKRVGAAVQAERNKEINKYLETVFNAQLGLI